MSSSSFLSLFANIEAILWVILFFGGSIFIHELGHFLAARKRGLKVERFSIGFGPKILSWTKKGVEYRISLLPFGGYVALPQLADLKSIEGSYKSNTKRLPPISYTDRIIVLVMGAVFNLIFALFLATLLWWIGQPTNEEEGNCVIGYVAKTVNLDESTAVEGPAYLAGLQTGDKILAIDDTPISRFSEVEQLIVTGAGRTEEGKPLVSFHIERAGVPLDIPVQPVLALANTVSGETLRVVGISPAYKIVVGKIFPNSPAQKAGLQTGDILLKVNKKALYSIAELSEYLEQHPTEPITLECCRGQTILQLTLTPEEVAYTQPSLRLFLPGKPDSFLQLIPDIDKTQQTLIQQDTPIRALLVYEIHNEEAKSVFLPLVVGDRIIGFTNGAAVQSINSFQEELRRLQSTKHESLIVQNGPKKTFFWDVPTSIELAVQAPQTHALLGFIRKVPTTLVHISPWEQFSNSVRMTLRVLASLFNQSSDIGVNNLMGPPGIIRALHSFSSIDLRLVLAFTVLLNINLAILNLLPIPVLDGGQILFATLARIRRRPLPLRLVSSIQETFLLLLFALMLYVSFFDVRRWQGDRALEKKLALQEEYYVEPSFKDQ